MTETVSGATTRKGKAAQAGRARLRMQRIHTTPGVHPYDQVTWERRDVVMTNWRDGSVNFEQHGVEFPDFWSVNAANIVTTKYFRGAVGSPQREWSLKQLIDRVVGTYEKAGQDHGYFAGQRMPAVRRPGQHASRARSHWPAGRRGCRRRQGLRCARRDPDRRDQGQWCKASAPVAHQGRIRARCDGGSPSLAII